MPSAPAEMLSAMPPKPTRTPSRGIIADLALAIVLGLLLSSAWAINDWPRLQWLTLPDSDDMMRLAQVRDWLGGQAFNDWTQYRMAPPHGAPMHWSRINDFGIAAIILGMTPLLGRHGAELAAVLAYPGLLFIVSIFLSARIARRLWSPEAGSVAAVLAVLAFPGIKLFDPGRIDHHGLQTVLIQCAVLALARSPSLASGVAAGLALAVSLVVGLETAPHVAILIVVLGLIWVWRGIDERSRLAGFAGGMAAATLFSVAVLRPTYWPTALCDAFTPATATIAMTVSVALAGMALVTPHVGDWRRRLATALLLGAVTMIGVLVAFPGCLSGPYGVMDPFLQHEFLAHIDEANPLFAQPSIARRIALGGLMTAGFVASLWMLWRRPKTLTVLAPAAAIVIVSAVIMLFQVRGTYIGTPLSTPILAGLVLAARRQTTWRLPALLGAWLFSTGIAYVVVPDIGIKPDAPAGGPPKLLHTEACEDGDIWQQISRYPAGIVLTPTNVAAYLIGATPMATVGAGYHRNDAANMDTYRYFLRTPEQGRAIAAKWRADYVAFCPGDFGEMNAYQRFPDSLAARLQHNRPPPWLERLPLRGASLRLYRIKRE